MYKVHTKYGLKLEMRFLYLQAVYKLYKTYTTREIKRPLHFFCTYTQCKNYAKCMQMLMESYMGLTNYKAIKNKINKTRQHRAKKIFQQTKQQQQQKRKRDEITCSRPSPFSF